MSRSHSSKSISLDSRLGTGLMPFNPFWLLDTSGEPSEWPPFVDRCMSDEMSEFVLALLLCWWWLRLRKFVLFPFMSIREDEAAAVEEEGAADESDAWYAVRLRAKGCSVMSDGPC